MTSVGPQPTPWEPTIFSVCLWVCSQGCYEMAPWDLSCHWSLLLQPLCPCQLSVVSVRQGEQNHDWSLTNWIKALCAGLKDSCKHPRAIAQGDDVHTGADIHKSTQTLPVQCQLSAKCGDLGHQMSFNNSHLKSPSQNMTRYWCLYKCIAYAVAAYILLLIIQLAELRHYKSLVWNVISWGMTGPHYKLQAVFIMESVES